MPPKPRPLADRLMEKIVKQPNGCWEFTGTRNKAGYGYIGRGPAGAGMVLAHRAMWELEHGEAIPPKQVVRHTCDNPPCVNPEHLVLGSQRENLRDSRSRGRWPLGERVSRARLTNADARAIRNEAVAGTSQARLGKEYGVSRETVRDIVLGRTYPDA